MEISREAKTCAQPVVNHDFYPTLLEAADIKPDPKQKLDGVSTLATWKNPIFRCLA